MRPLRFTNRMSALPELYQKLSSQMKPFLSSKKINLFFFNLTSDAHSTSFRLFRQFHYLKLSHSAMTERIPLVSLTLLKSKTGHFQSRQHPCWPIILNGIIRIVMFLECAIMVILCVLKEYKVKELVLKH